MIETYTDMLKLYKWERQLTRARLTDIRAVAGKR